MAEEEDKETAGVADEGLVNQALEKASVKYGSAVTTPIHYPLNLEEQIKKGRPHMRLRIISRDLEEKRSIYLLTPVGLSVPDGSTWNNVNLGTLLGAAAGVAKRGATAIKNLTTGQPQAAGRVIGVEDLVAASTLTAIESFAPVIGEKGLMSAGIAANPYTNTQFSGTNLRTFEFTFKLIAESLAESDAAREIENTFRKFLYPRTHAESKMVLVYPPLWEITFLKGESHNPYMPRLHLCNMTALNVVYNTTGNSYHEDGSPTEMDISISFSESKTLTRDDLYGDTPADGPVYDNIDYDNNAFWPNNKETAETATTETGV